MVISLLTLCTVTLCVPQGPDLQASMKQMSEATTALASAIEKHDADARTRQLDALDAALVTLLGSIQRGEIALEPRTDVERLLGELRGTVGNLRKPLPDATASDAWDLGRLRGACTHCHLQVRTDNAERGLFPNRGGAVFGHLAIEQQDGTPQEDRSGAVVFLESPGLESPPWPRKPVISQKGRAFQPSVLAVTTGTVVRFPNDDVVFHNVFSLSRGNAFDLGTYGKGTEQERVLGTPGLVKVHCNIHPDMAAQVLVLRNSYAAISSPSGFWSIAEVPPGEYTLRVWQGLAEPLQQTVRVAQGEALEVKLKVRETRPRVQHNNKFGRPYKNY
ncbi:MAG: hypothetical protein KA020_11070 [Planctomycetes bacterium]|jgi:hypothetical protein|nr:hypothetical protein [Planctomycetota bacterium]MCC7064159.1 hypothetical protein [Planctomycetota bacterium]